ncbi:hypothetical protein J3B02_005042 [Coemansia erecta]|nr:hypothetical protein J3B02_005042 [Coemansia erecta]
MDIFSLFEQNYASNSRFYTERGSWSTEDSDVFYSVLSKYTELIDGVLQLNHQFLDKRETEIIEDGLKRPMDSNQAGIPHSIYNVLVADNDTNMDKACDSMFALINEIYMATEGRHTVRQINNKHINARSKCAVPFKYVNEFGAFIKSQTNKRTKRNIGQFFDAQESDCVILTNLEPKSYPLIKALLRFVSCRELFWSDEYSVPADPLVYAEHSAAMDIEPSSDIERWMQDMIRRHGRPMVDYLDTCACNLVNSYLLNLVEWGEKNMSDPVKVTTSTPRKYLVQLLGRISVEARVPPASCAARIPKSLYSMRVFGIQQLQQMPLLYSSLGLLTDIFF